MKETPEYLAEIDGFRAERLERLREPDSWLSLVGLFWLREGEQSFGSGEGNDLVFPAKAPERLGTFNVRALAADEAGDSRFEVRLETAPEAEITREDEAVGALAMRSDAVEDPTVLEAGSLRFYLIERGDEIGLRLKDTESEALTSFEGIETFPTDAGWNLEARFEAHDPPKTVPIPNILGQVNDLPSPGAVVFTVGGETYRLDAVAEPGDDLFLIFGDETNGAETYGAGRFLYAAPPDADGKVQVDFNKSYNPPCVFTPYATCPLPPKQNKLALRIEAGEKSYEGGVAH